MMDGLNNSRTIKKTDKGFTTERYCRYNNNSSFDFVIYEHLGRLI